MLLYRSSIHWIAENATKGTFVFRMKATDRDSGTNAVIKYSFSPEESAFIINETTGVVTVNGSLDRETKASDGEHNCTANLLIILIYVNPSLNGSSKVTITVTTTGTTASCVSLCVGVSFPQVNLFFFFFIISNCCSF